jgi:hypothetical protein
MSGNAIQNVNHTDTLIQNLFNKSATNLDNELTQLPSKIMLPGAWKLHL